MISDVVGSLLQAIPGRKNSAINNKLKRLRQEDWYKEMEKQHGNTFIYNSAFRALIYENDVEDILKDEEQTKKFQEKLMQLLS